MESCWLWGKNTYIPNILGLCSLDYIIQTFQTDSNTIFMKSSSKYE